MTRSSKFLLDNKYDDILLKDSSDFEQRIYLSDLLTLYHNFENINSELQSCKDLLNEKCTYNPEEKAWVFENEKSLLLFDIVDNTVYCIILSVKVAEFNNVKQLQSFFDAIS